MTQHFHDPQGAGNFQPPQQPGSMAGEQWRGAQPTPVSAPIHNPIANTIPAPQPLLELPEPPRLPSSSTEVDLPEEILLDSRAELRSIAGFRPYLRMAITGAIEWTALALMFVSGLSSTMGFLLIGSWIQPGIVDVIFRSLGVGLGQVAALVVIAPVFGALVGALSVIPALRSIARLRPREYMSERSFRDAIAHQFAKWQAFPQVAAVSALVLWVLLPLPFGAWKSLTYLVVGTFGAMYTAVVLGYWLNRWQGSQANVLRLPPLETLNQSLQTAPTLEEHVRFGSIVQAQDRRHLPPNSFRFSTRAFAASLGWMLRYRVWAFVFFASLIYHVYFWADLASAFKGLYTDPGELEVSPDFSVLSLSSAVVLAIAWAMCAALIPQLVLLLPKKLGIVHDLRTYPRVEQRLAVNAWEKRAVSLGTGAMTLCEVAILCLLVGAFVLGGDWHTANIIVFVLAFIVLVPFSAWGSYRMFTRELRSVAYGPAHWYARRKSPFAAITPQQGTKAELEHDPRIRAEILARKASALGMQSTATPDEVANASLVAGILPDFGIEEKRTVSLDVEERPNRASHDIPQHLEELDQ